MSAAVPSDTAPKAAARLARVAIVGRPNVGKSTLLNRLCRSRIAIVEPTAGVTRDRVAVAVLLDLHAPLGLPERWVELTDTGGIGIVDRHDLGAGVEAQVLAAVEQADAILFVVDVRDGLLPLDQEVARRLRGVRKPVLLLANKAEGREAAWNVAEFRRLGLEEGPFPISAQNGEGLEPVLERLGALLPPEIGLAPPEPVVLRLAVVGQRNAGKSTLINRLAGEERMLVSEIPGTTRDAVDVRFERDGKVFVAIDTAGLRKHTRIADAVEFFSDARSHKSVRRADVTLLLFDVSQPLSAVDKKLARYALDRYKPLVLCANKWDLVAGMERAQFVDYLRGELPNLAFAPIVFLSALSGEGVERLLSTAERLHEESQRRVPTGELNRILERATQERSPSSDGARVAVYYATQADSAPPTFVLFVNDRRLVGRGHLRYLTNRLREELDLAHVPLRIVLRDRREAGDGGSEKGQP